MFTFAGNTSVTIDDKSRLALPAKFRSALAAARTNPSSGAGTTDSVRSDDGASTGIGGASGGGGGGSGGMVFFCVPLGDSLLLVPEPVFQELGAQGGSGGVKVGLDGKMVSRARFFGLSERIELDGAQRLLIPKELLARIDVKVDAKTDARVHLSGAGDHLVLRAEGVGAKEREAWLKEDELA